MIPAKRGVNMVRAAFLTLVSLLFVTPAWPQIGTTSLHGGVFDSTGAVVPGAKVELTNSSQAFHRETETLTNGEYEFLALPPGNYSLTVLKSGFHRFEQQDLQLLVNNPATVDVTLVVGSVAASLVVSAQAVALNTTDATLGLAFGETAVKQLPLDGRNVPDLLSLQTGVVYTGNRPDINADVDTRSGAVNGARSDQSNVTLDGIPVNDAGGHAFTSVLPVTLDSVQEFRVTTTNFNADQGGSSGAQVALVTKGGTNEFHGSVYEYNRNTLTSANDYFVKKAELFGGEPNEPPKLIRNVFGASFGGPIKKDRLFFFANFEGTRRSEEQSVVREIPTAALRDGVVQYLCQLNSDGSLNTTACPGGLVQGASGAGYNVPAGYFGLSPKQIKGMDPLNLGPDPLVMNYFSQYPLPNDSSVGDGFNFSGFRFRGPIHDSKNWYITRMDYNITGKHRLSVTGAVANERNPQVPFLPGTQPETTAVERNRGIIVNYNASLSSNVLNSIRYGYVREGYSSVGDSNLPWIFIGNLDQGVTRTSIYQRFTHTIVDDFVKIHKSHTFQLGVSTSFIRNPQSTTANSFSHAETWVPWLDTSAFLNKTQSPFSPDYQINGTRQYTYPSGDPSFSNAYDFPLIGLLGMVTQGTANYII